MVVQRESGWGCDVVVQRESGWDCDVVIQRESSWGMVGWSSLHLCLHVWIYT